MTDPMKLRRDALPEDAPAAEESPGARTAAAIFNGIGFAVGALALILVAVIFKSLPKDNDR